MSERPNVFVTYQDATRNTHMGCAEIVVSVLALITMAGWLVWPW